MRLLILALALLAPCAARAQAVMMVLADRAAYAQEAAKDLVALVASYPPRRRLILCVIQDTYCKLMADEDGKALQFDGMPPQDRAQVVADFAASVSRSHPKRLGAKPNLNDLQFTFSRLEEHFAAYKSDLANIRKSAAPEENEVRVVVIAKDLKLTAQHEETVRDIELDESCFGVGVTSFRSARPPGEAEITLQLVIPGGASAPAKGFPPYAAAIIARALGNGLAGVRPFRIVQSPGACPGEGTDVQRVALGSGAVCPDPLPRARATASPDLTCAPRPPVTPPAKSSGQGAPTGPGSGGGSGSTGPSVIPAPQGTISVATNTPPGTNLQPQPGQGGNSQGPQPGTGQNPPPATPPANPGVQPGQGSGAGASPPLTGPPAGPPGTGPQPQPGQGGGSQGPQPGTGQNPPPATPPANPGVQPGPGSGAGPSPAPTGPAAGTPDVQAGRSPGQGPPASGSSAGSQPPPGSGSSPADGRRDAVADADLALADGNVPPALTATTASRAVAGAFLPPGIGLDLRGMSGLKGALMAFGPGYGGMPSADAPDPAAAPSSPTRLDLGPAPARGRWRIFAAVTARDGACTGGLVLAGNLTIDVPGVKRKTDFRVRAETCPNGAKPLLLELAEVTVP